MIDIKEKKMQVIRNENVVPFDVDGTLVLRENPGDRRPIYVVDPADGKEYAVYPHRFHIEQLIKQKGRGFPVIVWSQAGFGWAENVVKALNLEHHVDLVMTKPNKYFDDLPASTWMGAHLYFPEGA